MQELSTTFGKILSKREHDGMYTQETSYTEQIIENFVFASFVIFLILGLCGSVLQRIYGFTSDESKLFVFFKASFWILFIVSTLIFYSKFLVLIFSNIIASQVILAAVFTLLLIPLVIIIVNKTYMVDPKTRGKHTDPKVDGSFILNLYLLFFIIGASNVLFIF